MAFTKRLNAGKKEIIVLEYADGGINAANAINSLASPALQNLKFQRTNARAIAIAKLRMMI